MYENVTELGELCTECDGKGKGVYLQKRYTPLKTVYSVLKVCAGFDLAAFHV